MGRRKSTREADSSFLREGLGVDPLPEQTNDESCSSINTKRTLWKEQRNFLLEDLFGSGTPASSSSRRRSQATRQSLSSGVFPRSAAGPERNLSTQFENVDWEVDDLAFSDSTGQGPSRSLDGVLPLETGSRVNRKSVS